MDYSEYTILTCTTANMGHEPTDIELTHWYNEKYIKEKRLRRNKIDDIILFVLITSIVLAFWFREQIYQFMLNA